MFWYRLVIGSIRVVCVSVLWLSLDAALCARPAAHTTIQLTTIHQGRGGWVVLRLN